MTTTAPPARTPEEIALHLAETDPYLQEESLLGESLVERMERFGLIVENANGNWDLSDRDENALRTANAVLVKQKAEIDALRSYGAALLEEAAREFDRMAPDDLSPTGVARRIRALAEKHSLAVPEKELLSGKGGEK